MAQQHQELLSHHTTSNSPLIESLHERLDAILQRMLLVYKSATEEGLALNLSLLASNDDNQDKRGEEPCEVDQDIDGDCITGDDDSFQLDQLDDILEGPHEVDGNDADQGQIPLFRSTSPPCLPSLQEPSDQKPLIYIFNTQTESCEVNEYDRTRVECATVRATSPPCLPPTPQIEHKPPVNNVDASTDRLGCNILENDSRTRQTPSLSPHRSSLCTNLSGQHRSTSLQKNVSPSPKSCVTFKSQRRKKKHRLDGRTNRRKVHKS